MMQVPLPQQRGSSLTFGILHLAWVGACRPEHHWSSEGRRLQSVRRKPPQCGSAWRPGRARFLGVGGARWSRRLTSARAGLQTPVEPNPPPPRWLGLENSETTLNCGLSTGRNIIWAMRSPGLTVMAWPLEGGLRFQALMKHCAV